MNRKDRTVEERIERIKERLFRERSRYKWTIHFPFSLKYGRAWTRLVMTRLWRDGTIRELRK